LLVLKVGKTKPLKPNLLYGYSKMLFHIIVSLFWLLSGAYLTLRFVAMGAAIALYESPVSAALSSSSISTTSPSIWSLLDPREPRPEAERRKDERSLLPDALCVVCEEPPTFRFAIWLGNSWKNLLLRLLPMPFANT
jgi:hypothetical protein